MLYVEIWMFTKFSKWQTHDTFLIFLQIIGFDLSCKLNERSKPYFGIRKIRKISLVCCLLKFSPSSLSINLNRCLGIISGVGGITNRVVPGQTVPWTVMQLCLNIQNNYSMLVMGWILTAAVHISFHLATKTVLLPIPYLC